MENPFASSAMRYFDAGFNVIPLRAHTKIPTIMNWQNWCETKLLSFQVENWVYTNGACNIGLPLGPASGVIALDFDVNVESLHDRILNILGPCVVRKAGNRGFTAFFKYNGETPKKWRKDNQPVLELLSTGNQTVLPPSIHPDSLKPYIWLTHDTLFDKEVELPVLPKDFIEQVNKLFGFVEYKPGNSGYTGEVDIKDVEKALSFIPSVEYSMWVTIGMALHHGFGDSAFTIWDAWSRKSANYNEKGMRGKWASFGKRSDVVSVGTIYHYAMGYGFLPVSILPEDLSNFKVTIPEKIMPAFNSNKLNGSESQGVNQINNASILLNEAKNVNNAECNFPLHLLDAPGLPGEIANWIVSTSFKRQPILALGAAIAAAGTIFAHKIKSPSNLRTNFMVLGLCESGSGKEHARECLDNLFEYCGLGQYMLGEFASDTGLLAGMIANGGIGFAMIDEIGRELKALNGKNAASFEGRILTMMMKMFSRAGTIYRGKQYADIAERERQDIVQPCLSVYGTTVPKRFYDNISSDDTIDGFLARWLIFESTDINPLIQEKGDTYTPPASLVENIKYIREIGGSVKQIDITRIGAKVDTLQIVGFSEGAETVLAQFTAQIEASRLSEIKKGSGYAAIWARTREHAIKLALVAHDYGTGLICEKVMAWAGDLAIYLSNYAIAAAKAQVTDNQHERMLNNLHHLIMRYNETHDNEPIPHRIIAQRTRSIETRKLRELLTQLQESGMIDVIEKATSVKGRLSYFYYANTRNF